MFEISTMIEDDIVKIREKYQISNDFHLHAPRPKDRVTSGPVNCLAVYEDLNTGLRFPLHPWIKDVLHRYDPILVQLGPNSFRILSVFVIIYHLAEVQPRL